MDWEETLGSDWVGAPKDDVALLQAEHELLLTAVKAFSASSLNRRASESQWTYAEHIHGIAAHDLYHAGQIQLLKRLRKGASR